VQLFTLVNFTRQRSGLQVTATAMLLIPIEPKEREICRPTTKKKMGKRKMAGGKKNENLRGKKIVQMTKSSNANDLYGSQWEKRQRSKKALHTYEGSRADPGDLHGEHNCEQ